MKTRLYTQARYDEEQEEWSLNSNIVLDNTPLRRPVSVPARRRPISEYSLQAIKQNDTNSVRYKGENIVNYELDMPLRTTYDYTNQKLSSSTSSLHSSVMSDSMHSSGTIDDEININDPVSLQQRIMYKNKQCSTRCCCTNILRVYVLYSLIRKACDPD